MINRLPSGTIRTTSVLLGGTLALALSMTALAATTPGIGGSGTGQRPGSAQASVLDGYAVLAGSLVTSTGATILNADLGVSPGTAVDGFPPGVVNGEQHMGDADAAAAQEELARVYAAAAARPPTGVVAAELGGQTLTPGTYAMDAPAVGLTGALTLDALGDPSAEFVLQVGESLDFAAASTVVLVNGAEACHVHWQVGDVVRLGRDASIAGDILAMRSVTLLDDALLDGRALARDGEVRLSSSTVVQSPCTTPASIVPPTEAPTESPTPSESPTDTPTATPTATPTDTPTATPTDTPTGTPTDTPTGTPTDTPTPPTDAPPNVVLVLVDDFSENLLPYMTEVQALATDGVTFANFFAATPWCCPSRATFQSGQYPHNTGVRSNGYPSGGFENFLVDDMSRSIGVQMQDNGYRTAFMGKYLNGYQGKGQTQLDEPFFPPDFVPPGWDDWFSGATGYQHFKYEAVESVDNSTPERLKWTGRVEGNYYTDVMSGRAQAFLDSPSDEPFFLMLTPFAPHSGLNGDPQGRAIKYPPAPRDRAWSDQAPGRWDEPEFATGDCGVMACPDVPWPDSSTPGNYNVVTTNLLPWMASGGLTEEKVAKGRELHIQRIQMIQSINDMIAGIRQNLTETGRADNTYILFASDNGYHLGEHALFGGKTTAYDHDVRVPMIVHPPGGTGVPVTIDAIVQNTDVLPTLLDIAGGAADPLVDGSSLMALMGAEEEPWRQSALLELTNDKHGDTNRMNPDTQGFEGDHVAPTYNALRTAGYLYVDYSTADGVPPADHEAEFYDLRTDPYQIYNRYPELPAEQRLELDLELMTQVTCGGAECWSAQSAVAAITLPPLP